MSVAYIGLGSNLGEREKNIERALEKLKARNDIEVKEVSPVIETEPVGDPAQQKFLNACCRLETALYPDELLKALKVIERELGRKQDSNSARISPEEQLRMLQEGNLDPTANLDALSDAKDEYGGAPKRWGPRTIDLDILFYDDIIMKGINLIIPHPRLHERVFVLKPLSEIAPDLVHPALKKSIKDLLAEFTPDVQRQM